MKIFWGPPPENPDFPPPAEEWNLVQEPDPRVSPLIELPSSCALGAGTFFLLREFNGFFGFPGNLAELLPLIVVTVIIHELLHSFGHPGFGLGPETRYGIWISRMAFFSRFEGTLARDRRLLITILPFFLLTITPIALLVIFNLYWWPVSFIALFNSLFAVRDLLNSVILIRQTPSHSVLRDSGWRTYWQPSQGIGEKGKIRGQEI